MAVKRIVITGGPGTGKTTLINALTKRGYKCFLEVSRAITLESQKNGIDQLFLTNPLLFSQKIITARSNQFKDAYAQKEKAVFFDRGVHDVIAYMNYINEKPPENFITICKQTTYNYVFTLQPWKAIYVTDNERYESFNQSLEIHKNILKTYNNFNYVCHDVPFNTVNNRVNFILEKLDM